MTSQFIRFQGNVLREEGTVMKEWKQRVAILDQGNLDFYSKFKSDHHHGNINLKGYKVEQGNTDSRIRLSKVSPGFMDMHKEIELVIVNDETNRSVSRVPLWIEAIKYHITFADTGMYPPTPHSSISTDANTTRTSIQQSLAANSNMSSSIHNSKSSGVDVVEGLSKKLDKTELSQSTSSNSYDSTANIKNSADTSSIHNSIDPESRKSRIEDSNRTSIHDSKEKAKSDYSNTSANPIDDSTEPIPHIKTQPREWFQRFDRDHSGSLDRSEFTKSILKTYPSVERNNAKSVVEALWKLFDFDEDHKITIDEFIRRDGMAATIVTQMPAQTSHTTSAIVSISPMMAPSTTPILTSTSSSSSVVDSTSSTIPATSSAAVGIAAVGATAAIAAAGVFTTAANSISTAKSVPDVSASFASETTTSTTTLLKPSFGGMPQNIISPAATTSASAPYSAASTYNNSSPAAMSYAVPPVAAVSHAAVSSPSTAAAGVYPASSTPVYSAVSSSTPAYSAVSSSTPAYSAVSPSTPAFSAVSPSPYSATTYSAVPSVGISPYYPGNQNQNQSQSISSFQSQTSSYTQQPYQSPPAVQSMYGNNTNNTTAYSNNTNTNTGFSAVPSGPSPQLGANGAIQYTSAAAAAGTQYSPLSATQYSPLSAVSPLSPSQTSYSAINPSAPSAYAAVSLPVASPVQPNSYSLSHSSINKSNRNSSTASSAPVLPAGWEEKKGADGRKYYVDHNTKSTFWSPPSIPVAVEVRGSDSSSGTSSTLPLPANWEEKVAPDGRTFYVDHNTKTTSWTRPNY